MKYIHPKSKQTYLAKIFAYQIGEILFKGNLMYAVCSRKNLASSTWSYHLSNINSGPEIK